jgi:two-component system, NarL family, nitrate/nitrite response regulator NarL
MKSTAPTARKIRLGIATDEPISGAGLHGVFRGREAYRVIWLPASMDRLLQAIQFLSVDIVLLDMACGFPDGIAAELRRHGMQAPVILWMRDYGTGQVPVAEGEAPVVVLDKRLGPEIMVACVDSVVTGQGWDETSIEGLQEPVEPPTSAVHISPREAELMDLVAEGLSNRQIAERLRLTEGSVKVYFSRLFRKLGVPDRVGLALYSAGLPWDRRVTKEPARRSGPGGS